MQNSPVRKNWQLYKKRRKFKQARLSPKKVGLFSGIYQFAIELILSLLDDRNWGLFLSLEIGIQKLRFDQHF